jgi:hypothetical protein
MLMQKAIPRLTAKTSKVIINHVDHVLYNYSGPVVVCHDRVEGVEGQRMNQDYSWAIGVVIVVVVFLLVL